jgi:hypothetical protein
VTVVNELTSRIPGVSETEAVANIVETGLKKEEHDVTGNTAATASFCEVSTELLLKNTIDELKLLLLAESDCIVGLLATSGAESVRTWRVVAALESFGRPKKRDSEATIHFIFWAGITCH